MISSVTLLMKFLLDLNERRHVIGLISWSYY